MHCREVFRVTFRRLENLFDRLSVKALVDKFPGCSHVTSVPSSPSRLASKAACLIFLTPSTWHSLALLRRPAGPWTDPFETDPHFLLGAVAAANDYNWPEAAREFELAMASPSAPAEADWAYASLFLQPFGRFDDSTAAMRRAVEKDPLSVIWRGVLMAHLVLGGRYEEALQEGLKALDISESEVHPHLAFGEAYLAVGKSSTRRSPLRSERIVTSRRSRWAPGFWRPASSGWGKDRAEALIREMGDSPTPIWGRAWYHLLCSEIEAAAYWYEKMIDAREMFAPVYANSLYTAHCGRARIGPGWRA